MKRILNHRYRNEVKGVFFTLFGQKKLGTIALLLLFTVFLLSGWIPDSFLQLMELLGVEGWKKLTIMWIICLVVVIIWIGLYIKVKQKQPPLKVLKELSDKNQILILLLSILNKFSKDIQPQIEQFLDSNQATYDDFISFVKSLLPNDNIHYNWEMPIRAIHAHIPVLQKVYVLTSHESSLQYQNFLKICNSLFPNIEFEEVIKGGVDFDDLENCFSEIDKIIKRYRRGQRHKTVIVDVTGGKVPTSIAAALSTLSYGQKFQYIDTEEKIAHQFDVVLSDEEN
ncbi:MAG: hypothetical protein N2450_08680 [bacterium]|nr:hypothetical protein [bacterium]